jgi:hypothetical protein
MLQNSPLTPAEVESPKYRQWPWRAFAFCSDLGTVGYLANKPRLGLLGWAFALPYYLYALIQAPQGQQRLQEMLYQATANGIFPFAEAKAGVMAAGLLYQCLIVPFVKKYPLSPFNRLTLPASKIAGGLTALFALTPKVGDPLSDWLSNTYKDYLKKGQSV